MAGWSVVIDGDDIYRIAPVAVEAIDTTGCGDAFMGTVLAGLASGHALADSAQLAHTFPRTPRLGSARKPLMVLPLRFVSGLVRSNC